MALVPIHSSLRSQASQQNAPASAYSRGQLQFRPAVRVTISERGVAQVGISQTASDILAQTTAAGRLAGSPYEANITLRRGAESYMAWSKS